MLPSTTTRKKPAERPALVARVTQTDPIPKEALRAPMASPEKEAAADP